MKKTSKKSTAKKTVKRVSKSPMMEMDSMKMPSMPKRCTIEKANGGYIIREGYGDKQFVAKDMGEAQKIQEKLLK